MIQSFILQGMRSINQEILVNTGADLLAEFVFLFVDISWPYAVIL
jgi:hypothetical protein